MSDSLRWLTKYEQPWANRLGHSPKMSKSLIFWANRSFTHLVTKTSDSLRKPMSEFPTLLPCWCHFHAKIPLLPIPCFVYSSLSRTHFLQPLLSSQYSIAQCTLLCTFIPRNFLASNVLLPQPSCHNSLCICTMQLSATLLPLPCCCWFPDDVPSMQQPLKGTVAG